MNREIIKISDYETEEYYTDWKQLVYIDETTTYIDLDRGCTDGGPFIVGQRRCIRFHPVF